jgi:hypothetical protein
MAVEISCGVLPDITARLLEEAAFVFTEPTDTPPPFEGDVVVARLSFYGPRRGWISITSSPAFAVDLAANLLGMDREDPESKDKSEDALREVLNMIGGMVIPRWFGGEQTARIGIPETQTITPEAHQAARRKATFAASLLSEDEHRIDLTMYAEGAN